MANRRLYRRTKAGTAAWQRQDPNVPLEFRRVLGVHALAKDGWTELLG